MSPLTKMKERTNVPIVYNGITGWDQLPDQILENIFGHLEHRNDILSLRRVSRHWNSVARTILERRTLQLWTNWDPSKRWNDINTFPEFKYILRQDESSNFWKKWIRKRKSKRWLSLFKTDDVNPFPNNSLHLPTMHTEYPHLKLSVNSFLEKFGQNLTSLQIDLLWSFTTKEMYSVLKQMTNLKALTIKEIYDGISEQKRINEELLPSPNPSLTHLRIGNRHRGDEPYIIQWLIKLFAFQLVSLELTGVVFCPFDKSWGGGAFQGLRQLEITETESFDKKFHHKKNEFLLEHLSLKSDSSTADNFKEINLSCIDKFAGSLRTLHFHYFDDFIQGDHEGVVTFPKLEKLVVFMTRGGIDTVDVIKTYFSPRFKNLTTLQLLNFSLKGAASTEEEIKAEAAEFCVKEGLWKLFPKLESIRIHPANFERLQPVQPFYIRFATSDNK